MSLLQTPILSADQTKAFLATAADWSDFARSLYSQLTRKGQLSPNQQRAVETMFAKIQASNTLRATAATNTKPIDLSPIEAMFDTARQNGLSKLAYRAQGLVISPAPSTSRNAGALYIKQASTAAYLGKVADAKYHPTSSATPDTLDALLTIASNPSQIARDYGKATGQCSCCGRQLTDPASIENGIGPICAEKWGL
jgi:hypothetical protein